MKSKGRGLRKQVYFSICSAHQSDNEDCPLCKVGAWRNYWGWRFGHIVYKISPRIWRFFANL